MKRSGGRVAEPPPLDLGVTPTSEVRWYFDASLLGVGKGFAWLRSDTTYPGAPGCPVTSPDVDDEDWLPIVAAEGWGVIMRDKRVRRRPAERQSLLDSGAVAFVLTGAGQRSKWYATTLLVKWWETMEETLDSDPGPAMYAVTMSEVKILTV